MTPNSLAEYNARYLLNQRYEGFGLGTSIVLPCPFCAAPDFMRSRIIEIEAVLSLESRCNECGRSARAVFTKSPGVTQFEIVQTGGPDQPSWLIPPMRRIS